MSGSWSTDDGNDDPDGRTTADNKCGGQAYFQVFNKCRGQAYFQVFARLSTLKTIGSMRSVRRKNNKLQLGLTPWMTPTSSSGLESAKWAGSRTSDVAPGVIGRPGVDGRGVGLGREPAGGPSIRCV